MVPIFIVKFRSFGLALTDSLWNFIVSDNHVLDVVRVAPKVFSETLVLVPVVIVRVSVLGHG